MFFIFSYGFELLSSIPSFHSEALVDISIRADLLAYVYPEMSWYTPSMIKE